MSGEGCKVARSCAPLFLAVATNFPTRRSSKRKRDARCVRSHSGRPARYSRKTSAKHRYFVELSLWKRRAAFGLPFQQNHCFADFLPGWLRYPSVYQPSRASGKSILPPSCRLVKSRDAAACSSLGAAHLPKRRPALPLNSCDSGRGARGRYLRNAP